MQYVGRTVRRRSPKPAGLVRLQADVPNNTCLVDFTTFPHQEPHFTLALPRHNPTPMSTTRAGQHSTIEASAWQRRSASAREHSRSNAISSSRKGNATMNHAGYADSPSTTQQSPAAPTTHTNSTTTSPYQSTQQCNTTQQTSGTPTKYATSYAATSHPSSASAYTADNGTKKQFNFKK